MQGDSNGGRAGLAGPKCFLPRCGGNASPGSGGLAGSQVSVDPNVIMPVRLCSLRVENAKKLLERKGLSKAVLESKKRK